MALAWVCADALVVVTMVEVAKMTKSSSFVEVVV